jgi:hypothetical protein
MPDTLTKAINGDPYIPIDLAATLAPEQSVNFSVFSNNPKQVLFGSRSKMFDDTTTCYYLGRKESHRSEIRRKRGRKVPRLRRSSDEDR